MTHARTKSPPSQLATWRRLRTKIMAVTTVSRRANFSSTTRRRLLCTDMLTQQRHKSPRPLSEPRDLIVAVPDMQTKINLSRIVRTAALFGVRQVIAAGSGRLDKEVSHGSEDHVDIRRVNTLKHPLRRLQTDGWQVIGLEQTASSESLFTFTFPRRTVLLVGHERKGISGKHRSVIKEMHSADLNELLRLQMSCSACATRWSRSQLLEPTSAATTRRQPRCLPCMSTASKQQPLIIQI